MRGYLPIRLYFSLPLSLSHQLPFARWRKWTGEGVMHKQHSLNTHEHKLQVRNLKSNRLPFSLPLFFFAFLRSPFPSLFSLLRSLSLSCPLRWAFLPVSATTVVTCMSINSIKISNISVTCTGHERRENKKLGGRKLFKLIHLTSLYNLFCHSIFKPVKLFLTHALQTDKLMDSTFILHASLDTKDTESERERETATATARARARARARGKGEWATAKTLTEHLESSRCPLLRICVASRCEILEKKLLVSFLPWWVSCYAWT